MNKNTENLKDNEIINPDGDTRLSIREKIKEAQRKSMRKRMRKTTIEIINYFYTGGSISYFLNKPSLPDACEECGAFKGSCFENRIMHLIPYYEKDMPVSFLCDDCFFEAKAKRSKPLMNE